MTTTQNGTYAVYVYIEKTASVCRIGSITSEHCAICFAQHFLVTDSSGRELSSEESELESLTEAITCLLAANLLVNADDGSRAQAVA